jgi:uncharacterized cupin superfamily protein
VVISGEIDLMLDNSVVHLKAGDTVVQQATNHAWVNRGKEMPATVRGDGREAAATWAHPASDFG